METEMENAIALRSGKSLLIRKVSLVVARKHRSSRAPAIGLAEKVNQVDKF